MIHTIIQGRLLTTELTCRIWDKPSSSAASTQTLMHAKLQGDDDSSGCS